MRTSIKFKTLTVVLLIVSMFSATMVADAGTVGFGEKGIPFETIVYEKTTADQCSDLTVGYVSFYTSVNAQTISYVDGEGWRESCPVTNCYYYESTYMGQYASAKPKVGQQIWLSLTRYPEMANNYTAEIDEWDYH